MQIKPSCCSNSTKHLYEFAEELGNFGSVVDEKRRLYQSTNVNRATVTDKRGDSHA